MEGFLPFFESGTGYRDLMIGPFLDNTDGQTAEAGLAAGMVVKISKDGAAFATRNSTTTIVYDANGYYIVRLNQDDLDTQGILRLAVNEAGALPVMHTYIVVNENFTNYLFIGGAVLDADIAKIYGDATAAENAGDFFTNVAVDLSNSTVGADVKKLSGDATAADNAKATFDGTGYAFPGSSIGADVVSIGGSSTLGAIFKAMISAGITGTAVTGTLSTTVMTTNLSAYGNDELNGRWLFFNTGNRIGEGRQISDYSATNGTITFAVALTGVPANGDTFVII